MAGKKKLDIDTFNEILMGALKDGVDPKEAETELLKVEINSIELMYMKEFAELCGMIKRHEPYKELEDKVKLMENLLEKGSKLEERLAALTEGREEDA